MKQGKIMDKTGILTRINQRRGSAAIEFAFIAPLMAVLAAAVIDFAWYVNRFYNIQQITRDSARIAATVYETSEDAGTSSVQAAIDHSTSVFGGLGLSCNAGCDVDVTYNNDEFRTITVEVTYPHQPLTGDLLALIGILNGDGAVNPLPSEIYSTFTMAVEVQ